VLTADLSLFGDRYQTPQARGAFYGELVDAVRALPGVTAAGAINNLPAVSVSDGPSRAILLPEDTDFGAVVLKRPVAVVRAVTPGYFAASGAALRAGHTFTGTEQNLVTIVSESLARRLWPDVAIADVVGRHLRQGGNMSTPLIEVIGVMSDARPAALDSEPTAALYRPYGQWPSGYMTLVARTAGDPAALAAGVKARIRNLDPDMPIASIRTMREIVSSTVAQRRLQMMLTALFAIVALLVGVVGVYGVTNYVVATRTKDIGVRLALGADRLAVLRWALSIGIRPVIIGLAIGTAAAMMVANVFRAALFGISAFDPVSFTAVVLVLLATSAIACYVPARRAASIDPLAALRHD
jgi:putative ABC transport system permease protein